MPASAAKQSQLVYDASVELLYVSIGSLNTSMTAYSGGSRGHSDDVSSSTATKYLHNQAGTLYSHMATTPELKDSRGRYVRRGGPLPPGHYSCIYQPHHQTFGECIQLKRHADARAIHSPFASRPIPHGRGDDFFIHGSGPKGSDGCIVLVDKAKRHQLNIAVKEHGPVTLFVKNVFYLCPAELEHQFA